MGLNAPVVETLQHVPPFRKFAIKERAELRFQVEALNLTNTPALNQPNATASTPSNSRRSPALHTGTSPQRTMRLGLRLA
jgi:hypothetical protein